MGRMLEALQKVHKVGTAREAAEAVRPLTAEELALFGVSRPTAPAASSEIPVATPVEVTSEAVPSVESVAVPPPPFAVATPEIPVTAPAIPAPVAPAPETAAVEVAAGTSAHEADEPTAADASRWRSHASEGRWADLAATVVLGEAVAETAGTATKRRRPESGQQRQCGELADRILAQLPEGQAAVLLFTPANETEADAALLAELALALTERSSGEVLVLDTDARRPRVGPYLGIESDGTLADVLQGRLDWREGVRRTKTARLSVLPGGSLAGGHRPENGRLAALLDELRSHYDLVLLAAASATQPEVAQWASQSQAAYLTVSLGQVTGRQLRQAARVLQRSGAALQGAIILE